ncbi:type II toxin-antitoxin system Phd/YefM family antitoxin [Acidithiobacillus sp. AMEEHan]|uniref:type II toxin-antitoxin system Phd/YefM family antitoxin n=1 Tax=Acidithiobacillus sp. AMEEHan TaxID=2994951 RepID=UPI0027E3DD9C|nr:type II toxin-antitoxin system Phd/YefM family antitoxin [Acidithiobacillus sp. AMEEHan]
MMQITSADAKNRFGELLDRAQREAVVITRHGRPSAVMISVGELESLLALQESRKKQQSALEELQEFFARSDKLLSPAAQKLSDEDVERLVAEAR